MRAAVVLCAATPVLIWASTPPARGHGIETSINRLEALNAQLVLQSQFSTGEPTQDALVRLIGPDGSSQELGRTDASGRLSFALPPGSQGSFELQVDGGPGHRDYLEMPVQGGQVQLDQISAGPRQRPLLWLSALGATAMLLGLQRTRRNR